MTSYFIVTLHFCLQEIVYRWEEQNLDYDLRKREKQKKVWTDPKFSLDMQIISNSSAIKPYKIYTRSVQTGDDSDLPRLSFPPLISLIIRMMRYGQFITVPLWRLTWGSLSVSVSMLCLSEKCQSRRSHDLAQRPHGHSSCRWLIWPVR